MATEWSRGGSTCHEVKLLHNIVKEIVPPEAACCAVLGTGTEAAAPSLLSRSARPSLHGTIEVATSAVLVAFLDDWQSRSHTEGHRLRVCRWSECESEASSLTADGCWNVVVQGQVPGFRNHWIHENSQQVFR